MTSFSSFSTAKKKLNPQQKVAVETLEGPVLTIAGPGTGKTQVLALRIAEILKKQPDVSTENILCLTYTNAGVIAMRKRLLSFIGSEAHKVEIHTFHSFCNQVIQENMEHFGVREAENISELEQFEFIEKILDSLPAKHLLFHKNSYRNVKDLLGLFGTMKSENWSEEDIQNAVLTYLSDLPNREEFRYKKKYKEFEKGDANPKKIKAEDEKMKKLLSAVHLFPQYEKMMKEQGMYDFNDMIVWVAKSFQQEEAILAKYQEQFQYILVDEFQDTNGSQKKIIDLLCSFWESPNIFVVGDDDQSIYRFQGANMRNIMEFYHQHKASLKTVTVEKNYRSSQNILDVAEHIIEKNTERLVTEIPNITKHLTAENLEYKNSNLTPSLIEYYNNSHQELGIIKTLKALQKKGVPLSDVAIIYQKHRQVENIIKVCEQENIPLRVKKTQDILEIPLIQQLLQLLQYFSEEAKKPYSQEDILYRSLFFSFFKIGSGDIGKLALWRRSDSKNKTFKSAIQNPQQISDYPELQNSQEILRFGEIFSELEHDFVNLPFLPFLEILFEKTGILNTLFLSSEKPFLLRALSTFFDFAKEQAQKNTQFSASQMLQKIQRMQLHNISLPIQKILYEKEGVNFITAHSSKGLEFEYVYLLGVEKKVWDKKQKNNDFSFPDTLTLSNEGNFLEEKRRLFFVALTRAKKYLEVSYCQKTEEGKELDHSIFISEFSEKIEATKKQYNEDEISEYQIRLLKGRVTKKTDFIQKELLEPILENYKMSATHLNKYMKCPLTFYFENLLRIPSAVNVSSAFGTAVHSALEKGYRKAEEEESFSYEDSLLEFFENSFSKSRYSLTKTEFEKFLRHGKEILSQYFQKYLAGKKIKKIYTEHQITTEISGVPVMGNLDRIDILGAGVVRVIDYKTGNFLNPNTKKKMKLPSDTNNFLGGDFWRQVVFYNLLVENKPYDKWMLQEAVIDFVEPKDGEFLQKKYVISEEEKEEVKLQIKSAYDGIMNMEFSGCNEEECEWCQRVKGLM